MLLDYVFMVPLDMGIAGAALGTGAGYSICAVTGALFFTFSKGALKFDKPVFDIRILIRSCLNGSSEMVSQLAAAVTTFLFNTIMMRFLGENGVAAITIIIYTQFLLTTLYIGFSMGVAPVISYNYGSGNGILSKKIFRICIGFMCTVSAAVFLSALTFGAPLVEIFTPKGTSVYNIARGGFRIFSFSFLFCGVNIFASAMFTAFSNGKISAVISFLRTFGLITCALLFLPRLLGVTGVWLAVPLAESVTVLFSACFILANGRKYHFL